MPEILALWAKRNTSFARNLMALCIEVVEYVKHCDSKFLICLVEAESNQTVVCIQPVFQILFGFLHNINGISSPINPS